MTAKMGSENTLRVLPGFDKSNKSSNVHNAVQSMIAWVRNECPNALELISFYSNLSTTKITNREILAEVSWIVYAGGFRYDVIQKYWGRISEALHKFEVSEVALLAENLEEQAKEVCRKSGFKNLRKAKWCIQNAQRIVELDNELENKGGLKGYFVELSKIDAYELVSMAPLVLDELRFKGIGKITIFHLLKNVGIDIFKPDIHVCRILSRLGLIDEQNASMLEICEAMCSLSTHHGIKLSELDTLLFVYGKTTSDDINF